MIIEVIGLATFKGIAIGAIFWFVVFFANHVLKRFLGINLNVEEQSKYDAKPTALSQEAVKIVVSVVVMLITFSVVVVELLTYLIS